MGRRQGGNGWGVCAVLAVASVVSAVVILGGGGHQQSHAPAFGRKVLLSITSGHPQINLDNILHPSQLQVPTLQSLDVNKQYDHYAPSPTIKHEGTFCNSDLLYVFLQSHVKIFFKHSRFFNGNGLHSLASSDEAVSASKQAVLPTMQPSVSPDHFYQSPEISPSIQSPATQRGNHHLQEQMSAASPSLPVEPHVSHAKTAVNTPAAAPFLPQPPWSSQPPPSSPSTGSQSTRPAPLPRIYGHSPSSFHTPPTGQDTLRVPVASPPGELPSKKKPPQEVVPPAPIAPGSSQDKDGISFARPPNNLPIHSRSPPKGTRETSHLTPAAPPLIHRAIQTPPQQRQRPHSNGPVASPRTTIHPANHGKANRVPVASPLKGRHHHSIPVNNTDGISGAPVVAPSKGRHHRSLPVNRTSVEGPVVSPQISPSIRRRGHGIPVAAPPKEPSSHVPPANHKHHKGSFPVISPAPHRTGNASATSHGHSGLDHSPAPAPLVLPPSNGKDGNPAYAPHHPHQYHSPSYSPEHALPPDNPAFRKPRALAPAPSHSLPPPPPNSYCTALNCKDPMTNSPPGTTCLCVLPIKVELRLGIALYTFFALVSELAQEIASGVFMKQSQVHVMGANAATEDPEKTIVLIDLVPLGASFDNTTTLSVFERFWRKQVIINPTDFGNYDVLNVQYPGLPSSPPSAPGNLNNSLSNGNDQRLHPLAADIGNHRETKGRGIIVIIVLSSIFALILCAGAALVIYFKLRNRHHLTEASLTPEKPADSAIAGSRLESRPISASPSFSSSIVAYKGSAKIFSLVEMDRATQRFDESRIIGEGGFGRVYEGILEDGERVAVKVLKRDDQQGTREFLAEVEMLSRLHHRNLVKLIGICSEEHMRCLVYELVPNGSLEFHLHGSDKDTALLDWDARLKIALGAARGLAYLHEDSSPRVIHRDFKSSNILLEHDFTPKVSDFGLARTAIGEGNEHISTRVMGTFGYVAPEYAMTGHLLVKSDVYSYGVVLLELLTGRKPVDMSRPPGQENLVTWACPFLTNRDGLETLIDASLGSSIPLDSIAKVAAIASMCVQPEVDQRPFMGEVVQALKLVCKEGSEFNESTSFSQDLHVQDAEIVSRASLDMDAGPMLSTEQFTASARYDTLDASGSFRRYSSSGPLKVGRTEHNRERGLSTGSSSEHCGLQRFRMDSE
ncbi:receptor-like serine/threonine-protein kinase ALE2 isoform X3 [Triticum dicoccoides]|uniref:receptor-like serine/threonine-protein kinase ALE2 isoform X3 n=1 Tax=Triticum dicoccoides TaxID=85692 RepID=UPI00188E4B5B|nr:receptor-like serine/threonine-protein kinase ALE2 isoform X3 [Triticum dicoccoides]